jgi:hypothetical protein
MLTYAQCKEMLEGKRRYPWRVLANNTRLYRHWHDDAFVVTLHGHEIVTVSALGLWQLDSCGWKTATTRDRMNRFSPARVTQEKHVWYVWQPGQPPDWSRKWEQRVPFVDGMWVDACGCAIGRRIVYIRLLARHGIVLQDDAIACVVEDQVKELGLMNMDDKLED